MTPSQVIIEEPLAWWLYAFLVFWFGLAGWFGYQTAISVWLFCKLKWFRKRIKKTSFLLGAAISLMRKEAVSRTVLSIGVVFTTCAMIRTSFCSFRQLDIMNSSLRLSYECRFLNRDIPLSSVRDIDVVSLGRHEFMMKIVTMDGTVYKSTSTHQNAVALNCQRFVEIFRKTQSK